MRPTHIRDYQMIQNRILHTVFTLFLGLSVLFVACDKMADDPEDTIENSISNNQAITFHTDERRFTLQWEQPENFAFRPLSSAITNDEGESVSVPYVQISLCDAGRVKGLGDITAIPTTGFSNPYSDPSQFNTSFGYTVGHGYIFKVETLSRTINPTPTGEVYYVRLYVQKTVVSNVLGPFGAKVSYQYPFEP